MYRRGYRPSSIQHRQSASGTLVETYRKRVDPTTSDESGRNAVHLSVLLGARGSVVDASPAVDDALDQV